MVNEAGIHGLPQPLLTGRAIADACLLEMSQQLIDSWRQRVTPGVIPRPRRLFGKRENESQTIKRCHNPDA